MVLRRAESCLQFDCLCDNFARFASAGVAEFEVPGIFWQGLRTKLLATKALGLVSLDTSPFCIAECPVQRCCSIRLRARCGMQLCPGGFHGRAVSVPKGFAGRVGEWLKPADCKSAAPCGLRRFESSPVHQLRGCWSGAGKPVAERYLGRTKFSGQFVERATARPKRGGTGGASRTKWIEKAAVT